MKKPLVSWADGTVRESIVRFVRRATDPTCTGYVPPHARIAVFDGDGTLWCERPAPASRFFLEGLQAHADLTASAFTVQAQRFMHTALHPRFGLPFGKLAYYPMLELLAYLRGKDFRPFIVAGDSAEFVRASSEELYGVPPERVAGTAADWRVDLSNGGLRLLHAYALAADQVEGEAKIRAIHERVGRQPVLAIGNSVNDCAMLEYTQSNPHPSLCLLLHHDDDLREYAYTLPGPRCRYSLVEIAAQRGWPVISMRNDFRRVFAARDTRPTRARHGPGRK